MQELFKGITRMTRTFIRSPVLLLGSMALFALIKVVMAPGPKD